MAVRHIPRPPTTAREGQAPPARPYTWRGDLPAHPDAPIPLCDDCGFLVTASAHHYTCEWPAAHSGTDRRTA